MARVLFIHDGAGEEPDSSLWLRLERLGHKVRLARAAAPHTFHASQADVVLVCCILAGSNAPALIARLRQSDPRVGIIKLANKGETQWRIDGMLAGADFCEPATVSTEVLSACIDAILRRIAPLTWRLDTSARILQAPDHERLDINEKELTLLQLLARSNRHAADRADIARAFGTDWLAFDERVLEKMVSRLRRKWREGSLGDLPLKTVHGIGYCFTEQITVY